jgi:hypothetical protein
LTFRRSNFEKLSFDIYNFQVLGYGHGLQLNGRGAAGLKQKNEPPSAANRRRSPVSGPKLVIDTVALDFFNAHTNHIKQKNNLPLRFETYL